MKTLNMDDFSIEGIFYTKRIAKKTEELRSVLEIKRLSIQPTQVDCIVIMMNPGSSSPLEKIKSNSKIFVKAVPDRTQRQIAKIMNELNFNYCRILNLSDLRTPKSQLLYQKLEDYKNDDSHSIFSQGREEELKLYLIKNVPYILGWGLAPELIPLAKIALNKIPKDSKICGIKNEVNSFSYKHPLPPNFHKQEEWLAKIVQQLKSK